MAAHAQVSGIIEKDHASGRRRVDWLYQQGTDQHLRPARFAENCAAVNIMITAQSLQAIRERTSAEMWPSGEYAARWLTSGMRVDDFHSERQSDIDHDIVYKIEYVEPILL